MVLSFSNLLLLQSFPAKSPLQLHLNPPGKSRQSALLPQDEFKHSLMSKRKQIKCQVKKNLLSKFNLHLNCNKNFCCELRSFDNPICTNQVSLLMHCHK